MHYTEVKPPHLRQPARQASWSCVRELPSTKHPGLYPPLTCASKAKRLPPLSLSTVQQGQQLHLKKKKVKNSVFSLFNVLL